MIILTAFLTFYATRLFYVIESFKTQMDYIQFNLSNFPTAFAAWTWLGIEKRIYMKLPYGALEAWNEGLKLRNNDFRLNWNMADTLAHLGFLDEAIRFYERTRTSAIPETSEDKWNKKIDEQIDRVNALKAQSVNNKK